MSAKTRAEELAECLIDAAGDHTEWSKQLGYDAAAALRRLAAVEAEYQRREVTFKEGIDAVTAVSMQAIAERDRLQFEVTNAHEAWVAYSCHLAAITAERDRLYDDNFNLRTTMVAAAEEISAHWPSYCDADGYGPANLLRRLECGIPSQYGYTAGAWAELKTERDRLAADVEALRADAERYRWLRDAHPADGGLWVAMGRPGSPSGISCWRNVELDSAIDAHTEGGNGD